MIYYATKQEAEKIEVKSENGYHNYVKKVECNCGKSNAIVTENDMIIICNNCYWDCKIEERYFN